MSYVYGFMCGLPRSAAPAELATVAFFYDYMCMARASPETRDPLEAPTPESAERRADVPTRDLSYDLRSRSRLAIYQKRKRHMNQDKAVKYAVRGGARVAQ